MATRYVNTASSAGGDGTTNATSGSTRAFATLREAIDALPGTLTEPYTIYCEGATADTQNIVQTNWDMTTSAANYIHIIGELSPNHPSFTASNTWDTGKYRLSVTNADVIYSNIPGHVRIEGLQVEMVVTDTGNEYIGLRLSTANNTGQPVDHRFAYCRIRKTGAGSSTTYGFFNSDPTGSGGTMRAYNCLAYDLSYGFSSDGSTWAQTNCRYLNCTAVDCTAANYVNSQINISCISSGANGFNATTASGSFNNACTDGSAVGTNSRQSVTFTFENAASDDFRLASGDTGARGFGLVDGGSGLYSDDILGFSRGGAWDVGAFEFPLTLEQEGFRWGVDDGSESAHGWEAAQDTSVTIADDQVRLLRLLVNATGDPTALPYTLRMQKNGAGGYAAVNLASTTTLPPVIEPADVTESGSNTASSSWAVSTPALATGDLLIMILGWDDSTDTTSVSLANGPNGETWTQIATVVASASTEVRMTAYFTKATGSWSAGTITVTPSASEQWTASVLKVPAGEFDATTPIGASATGASSGTAESTVNSPALTVGSTDGGGRVIFAATADTDPQTSLSAGYTELSNTDRGAVSLSVNSRTAAVTNSQSLSLGDGTQTIASDSWCALAFVVRGVTVTNEVYIDASANIAAGGEATTARLTAPSGKTTGDFVTGRRWDDENGTDTLDITTDDYTEVEWLVRMTSAPATNDYFEFRVYAGANALDVYPVTPRWTIPSAGGSSWPYYYFANQ